MKLNNEQLTASRHVNGPMLVVAGPGSGKTRLLVERIRFLIEEARVNPNNILVITFSKKAAMEMQQRFVDSTPDHSYSVNFGTFHSIFFHIILNYQKSKDSIVTKLEKTDYIKFAGQQCGIKDASLREWQNNMLELISSYKNIGDEVFNKAPGCFMSAEEKTEFHKVYMCYMKVCKSENKIDFDDMILQCLNILESNNAVLEYYRNKFKYILIDEFQDINQYQYRIIKLLSGCEQNIFCVGDDDQSIYGFRGAYSDIMKKFMSEFNEVKTVFLKSNYRSGNNIVELSNRIIADNKGRITKESVAIADGGVINFNILQTKSMEEKAVIDIIKNISGELDDTAIIVRTNIEAEQYSGLLIRNHIDVYGIKDITGNCLDSFIWKDILSFLKFVYEENYREYFIEFMNKPNKGIKRISLLNEKVFLNEILKFYEFDTRMKENINGFFKQIKLASGMKRAELAISIFRKTIGYDMYLRQIADSKETYEKYIKTADMISDIFKNYDFKMNLEEFSNLISEINDKNATLIKKGVHIMTMHASKGLEFNNVILPDINEGIIPPKNLQEEAIEEERRLLYVAVTRARNNLYILATKERNRDVSRFIKGKI